MNNRITKTEYFMKLAEDASSRTTCLSRGVGAVIVKEGHAIATGYNGSPKGCIHCIDIGYCKRRKMGFASGRGLEFCRAGHAESNAIDQCSKLGVSTKDATIYVTTQPCTFCAIRIIQNDIKKVVFKGDYPNPTALELFKEANIIVRSYEKELKEELELLNEKNKKEEERVKKYLEENDF